jgi:hypothetical protein
MKQIKPGTDLAGTPYTAKDLEGFAEKGSGAYLEDKRSYPITMSSETHLPEDWGTRDPRDILHDMKTEARANPNPYEYFAHGPLPTRGAEQPETPRIGAPGTGFDDEITSESMKLASGVYEGAGGYEYEVMPGGEIKILKAPKGRGVGVTLKLGHPAHEAIFDELSESGASPMTKPSAPAEEYGGVTLAERASRESIGGVEAGDQTIAGGGTPKIESKPPTLAKK